MEKLNKEYSHFKNDFKSWNIDNGKTKPIEQYNAEIRQLKGATLTIVQLMQNSLKFTTKTLNHFELFNDLLR